MNTSTQTKTSFMKKIFTHFLPVLGLVLTGTNLTLAQNEKKSNIECENEVSFPVKFTNVVSPVAFTKSLTTTNMAQLYDNGPLVNFPGQGSGGTDASATHDGLITYGFGHSFTSGIRVADDFTVPAAEKWTIDSIVFYAYQTGSTTTSTFNGLRLAVRNASPLTNASPAAIVWGDTTTDVLDNTSWSGIYRATSATLTATSRPIMRNAAATAGLQLLAGQYWLDWQSSGTATSGPWAPPISFPTQTITGDAIQFNAGAWVSLIDTAQAGTTDDAAQGIPFTIYGTISNSVDELYSNTNVSLYPNPMTSTATVEIADNIQRENSGFSFAIYDVIGGLIRKTDGLTTNRITIKKDNIPAGVYIYEVLNGNDILKRGKLAVQ